MSLQLRRVPIHGTTGYQLWSTSHDIPVTPVFAYPSELKAYLRERGVEGAFATLSAADADTLVDVEWCPTKECVLDGQVPNGAEFLARVRKQMTWDEVAIRARNESSTDVFVQINEGDSVTGVFLGEPYTYAGHQKNGPYLDPYEVCTGTQPCMYCQNGLKSQLRILLNFYSEHRMRVLDCSVQLFKEVFYVREKYGLDKWEFSVRYEKQRYTVLPERELEPWLKYEISLTALHDLYSLKG